MVSEYLGHCRIALSKPTGIRMLKALMQASEQHMDCQDDTKAVHTWKAQQHLKPALLVLCLQVFKQQADAVKMEQQQRRHAAKLQAGERTITAQLQQEEQTHHRVVAARKV